jgi:hypothetical protein
MSARRRMTTFKGAKTPKERHKKRTRQRKTITAKNFR